MIVILTYTRGKGRGIALAAPLAAWPQIRNLPWAAALARPLAFGQAASFAAASGSAFAHFASCFGPSFAEHLGERTPGIGVALVRPAFAAFVPLGHRLRSCPFI